MSLALALALRNRITRGRAQNIIRKNRRHKPPKTTDPRRKPEEEESGLSLPYHRLPEDRIPSIMTISLPPRSSATADPTYSGMWSRSNMAGSIDAEGAGQPQDQTAPLSQCARARERGCGGVRGRGCGDLRARCQRS